MKFIVFVALFSLCLGQMSCNQGIECQMTGSTLKVSGSGAWTALNNVYNWVSVQYIEIGKDITSIELKLKEAFLLRSVTCAEGCQLKKIGDGVFNGCTSSFFTTFPSATLQEIGKEAFKGTMIASFNFNSIKTIGDNAFENTKLKDTLTFPATLESIGVDAFKGCQITGYSFPNGNPVYSFDSSTSRKKITT